MMCLSSELTFEPAKPIIGSADKLRGSIASQNMSESLYHQHSLIGVEYRYPLIHYHLYNNKALITGWLRGVDETKKLFMNVDFLKIGDEEYEIPSKSLVIREQGFGLSDEYVDYRFIFPWLALNSDNYQRYVKLSSNKRLRFLEKILTGNILSASKGLNYKVENNISVSIKYVKRENCTLKGLPIIAFSGVFRVNFLLPELFGLGKSVSRGFGAVRRI